MLNISLVYHLIAYKILSHVSNHLTSSRLCKFGYFLYRDERTSSGKFSNLTSDTGQQGAEAELGRQWHAQGVFEIHSMVDTNGVGRSLTGDKPNRILECGVLKLVCPQHSPGVPLIRGIQSSQIHTDKSKLVVTRGWGGEERKGEPFNRYRVSGLQEEEVMEIYFPTM